MKRMALAIVLALILFTLGNFAAAETAEPVHLVFATMKEGTGAYAYAAALAEIMEAALPEGSEIELTTDCPGSMKAPELIEEGACDLAMSNAAPAYWYSQAHEDSTVRALAGGLGCDFINVMMTEQFANVYAVNSLEDIVRRQLPVRLAVKEEGSLGELAARRVLAALGATYEDIETWGGAVIHTDSAGISTAFLSGEADLTIDHISAWQQNTTRLCEKMTMRFPQLAESTLNALCEDGFGVVVVEPGMFAWQTESIATVGSRLVVLISENVDDEVAYALTKAVCENSEELALRFSAMEDFDPRYAGSDVLCGAKLHPGATDYYWEKGYSSKAMQ